MAKITSSGPSSIPILRQILEVQKKDSDTQADALERIQQQLAMINEDTNLTPGERHYDDG